MVHEPPGVDLVSAAPASDWLQPRRAPDRHDGSRRPGVERQRRQGARGAGDHRLLRRGRRTLGWDGAERMKISSFSQFAMARALRCRPVAAARAAGLAAGLALTLASSSAEAQVRTRYERVLAQARRCGSMAASVAAVTDPTVVAACEAVAVAIRPAATPTTRCCRRPLSLAAFRVFGSNVDREDAERLLVWLVRGYPSSSLRQKAMTLLRTAQAPPAKRASAPTRQARIDILQRHQPRRLRQRGRSRSRPPRTRALPRRSPVQRLRR